MKTLRFVWIDDQATKISRYRAAIQNGPGDQNVRATIDSVIVQQDLISQLLVWAQGNVDRPPHLLLIDHVFNTVQPFGAKGSSAAHLLRITFPAVPMVCVTAMLNRDNAFDQEDLFEYTAIFAYTHLERSVPNLFAIARDFPKLLCRPSVDCREHLVSCLKAPRREKEDVQRLLPSEFYAGRYKTTEHRVAWWIYNVLLLRPGLLYDRLNAATLLGLTEEGFGKVARLFPRSRYAGVFASPTRPLWWAAELRRELYDTLGEDAPDIPQLAGRSLPNIVEADYSVCYVSKKANPAPDAVAYADATDDAKPYAVQRQYAGRHPDDPGASPGFEIKLVLKKKKSGR